MSTQVALRLVKSEQHEKQAVSVPELEVAVKEWGIALRQSGASARTIEAYQWHVNRLIKWLMKRGAKSPRDVTRIMLREWGASLYDRWQTSTIKQAIGATRSFFKWCREEQLIDANPAEVLKTPKVRLRIQRTISAAEVEMLIANCDPDSAKGLRDRAMISLLYDSGLRAAELCRLKTDKIDLENVN